MAIKRTNTSAESVPDTCSVETALILTGVSTAGLARYERVRIITPVCVSRQRLYRTSDLKRIRKAHRLEHDLGVNLPGVEVILRLTDQIDELQQRLTRYETRARSLRP